MITENYIKMCREAKEIHFYFLKDKDIMWYGIRFAMYTKKRGTYYGYSELNYSTYETKRRYYKLVWLPTQDELQEMVLQKRKDYFNSHELMDRFFSWWNSLDTKERDLSDSFNEIWLRYVMYEKYHKTWNGEAWV